MPHGKSKPSKIAAEAKTLYIPYIIQEYPQFPARSLSYPSTDKLRVMTASPCRRLRIAVIEGDPVDVALDWHDTNCKDTADGSDLKSGIAGSSIPVVSMANEERPGGDWESSTIAPEECLCRRSTLIQALVTPALTSSLGPSYPLQVTGGIYSPSVVVFRASADNGYTVWKEFRSLPVISVAPIRRPKLNDSGLEYSFEQEKELMKDKMRAILRIAIARQHPDLCMGAFGVGFGFKNPAGQVARMWRELLFCEREFEGRFSNVVFAIEKNIAWSPSESAATDIDIFKEEFDPSNIAKTSYR